MRPSSKIILMSLVLSSGSVGMISEVWSDIALTPSILSSSSSKNSSDDGGKKDKNQGEDAAFLSTEAKLRKKRRAEAKLKRAGEPTLTVKGSAAFNAYMGSQSNKDDFTLNPTGSGAKTPRTRNSSTHFAFEDATLEFKVLKALEDFKNTSWGLNIAFSGTKKTDAQKVLKRAYLSLMSDYGTTYLGNYAGVEDLMAFSGGSVLGNIGFTSGGPFNFAPATTGVKGDDELFGTSKEATKITVTSSRWKGFMLGASYTPSTRQLGDDSLNTGTSAKLYSTQHLAYGLNYVDFVMPDLKLSLSVTGLTSKTQPYNRSLANSALRPMSSVAFGGVLSYRSFSFGAEYVTSGKSGQFAVSRAGINPGFGMPALNYDARQAQGPRWFDVGVSYMYKQTKFAAGYLGSSRRTGFGPQKARGDVYNVSVTYQPQPGLDFYVEGFRINTRNPYALYEGQLQASVSGARVEKIRTNQKANVVVMGMKVSF